ncbi:hypothetical protein KP509_15G032500 [Ceratopteris richardii]|uniref:Uncharacterized protein n=1 Tax=Ceratopteris richardii TaxID=49495 RepID=A0A8T2T888_CERRI|nr:hypothetical protein KP509_15G032500 [Ceratopteris richardii]
MAIYQPRQNESRRGSEPSTEKQGAVVTNKCGGSEDGNIKLLMQRMAGWFGSGLYTAFFTSMDTCACIKLETVEEPIPLRKPFKNLSSLDLRRSEHLPSPLHDDHRRHRRSHTIAHSSDASAISELNLPSQSLPNTQT